MSRLPLSRRTSAPVEVHACAHEGCRARVRAAWMFCPEHFRALDLQRRAAVVQAVAAGRDSSRWHETAAACSAFLRLQAQPAFGQRSLEL